MIGITKHMQINYELFYFWYTILNLSVQGNNTVMGMMSDFVEKKNRDKDKDKDSNSDSYLIELMNDLNLEKQCKTGQVNLT